MTQQDYIRRQNMCKGFLRSLPNGRVLDAMQAAASIRESWGVSIDWHDMSDALESLHNNGGARAVGYGAERMTLYVIEAVTD